MKTITGKALKAKSDRHALGQYAIYDDGGSHVANTFGPSAERHANLFVHAPELFDALKELRDWCDNNINGVPFEYGKVMEQADLVLNMCATQHGVQPTCTQCGAIVPINCVECDQCGARG